LAHLPAAGEGMLRLVACDILCIGEPLYELSQQPDGRFLAGFGGDTSNVAVAAARLGARTAYVTLVGNDMFGAALLKLWRDEGVDTAHVSVLEDAPTGLYFITHGPGGHAFTYRRAGSAATHLAREHISREAIAGARFLHVSDISQAISASAADAVSHAVSLAQAAGTKISYDTNLRLRLWPLDRAREVIAATAAVADILKTSQEDAETLTGLKEPEAIARHFFALGSRVVIVTMGEAGAFVLSDRLREVIAAYPVKTVDASGAGDAFTGALLSELAAGCELVAACRFAAAAAAISTTGHGAVSALPRRADVEALKSESSPGA
jgi:2-dehydro-3-deoxygluconokinase